MSGSAPPAKLPDDPALHMCALAYASDFSLLDAAMARYGRTLFDKRMMPASLDHAMWFHRPFRADEWLLYAQDSPSAQGGRGLTRGMIFKQDGTLVASVAQEGSLRERQVKAALASVARRADRICRNKRLEQAQMVFGRACKFLCHLHRKMPELNRRRSSGATRVRNSEK